MNRKTIAALVGAAGLAVPAAASAHVTLQPNQAPAGGYVRLDVRVPNEKEKGDTTKVVVRFPKGFAEASYEPVPGWTVSVEKRKLATPVKTDDGEVTEEVSQITWSGGRIAPGEFQDFGLSVQVPGKAGDFLTFKALQTYSDGEVVRWIGTPDSDQPAPQVKVTAAKGEDASASSSEADDGEDDSNTLAVIALIVGGLGLLLGLGGIARRRS
jgi:uncharacterized protein